ncbi:hypothetical protein SEA_NEFERTHENA_33 [Microbacterium phage Neferthena]|uniref:SAP domain-containing protein n=1 Tax=Microbacterium phage Neferthena TaxID=2301539 RepID=A0A385D5A1_9CAUD|nr:hypothetical protein HOT92_gp33 [Microbacterium phage Neferthena]AXQ52897.1 hypothetical protein SEA_NEFERTHENA_33 [Microbacterium phage Neferthena]
MGKKITLDFSKVEERSGWNSKEMPEGLHEFKVELVDLKDANDGTAMWTYGLRPTNPKYKTRLFPYYCKHQANQLFKLRDLFTAAGIAVPKKRTALDPDAPVGKIIAAEVSDATGQYAGRSEIDGVYDRSIIDDDDRVADDEDEIEDDEVEDEEYDEDEDEGEEEGDEEEDDELREEIEALTLAALRKRAKGLGIDTDGVKKDELVELVLEEELAGDDEEDDEEDDDEDLGDEDLEDEDFDDEEDEEEEPEPAPRRRAAPAKKPAAKAPAKAAAPARRTVRRR